MWRILQQDQPDDYVLATGETHTIREFVELAFKEVGIILEWKGTGVDILLGDPAKAETKLGWERKVDFPGLVKLMVEHDLANESKAN